MKNLILALAERSFWIRFPEQHRNPLGPVISSSHSLATWKFYRGRNFISFWVPGDDPVLLLRKLEPIIWQKVILSLLTCPLGQRFWFSLLEKYALPRSAKFNRAAQAGSPLCPSSHNREQELAWALTPEIMFPWPSKVSVLKAWPTSHEQRASPGCC